MDDQALYLAQRGTVELGHRFLLAAHETFNLLAANPGIGWPLRFHSADLKSVRVFPIEKFKRMLVLYCPAAGGIEVLRVIHGSRNVIARLRREGLEF